MGQARNLQQVGKGFRLALEQHLPDKGGTHFRNGQGAVFALDLLRRHTKRFGRRKELVYLRVGHIDLGDRDPGVLLKVFVDSRDDMPEVV